jgi:hypothetical protein|tara:strand:+ start:108 stop:317 length:210 start_codon:yes stop_codon:yes gene_type:complete
MNEEKATLGKQGQLFQISPERVPQIEHSVFAKIQKIVMKEHQRVTNSVFKNKKLFTGFILPKKLRLIPN